MLSTKKSAQTLVFIAFLPFMTIPTEKSWLKQTQLFDIGFIGFYFGLFNSRMNHFINQ